MLVAILAISVGITHGLVLLNDGIYWDDWLVYTDFIRHDWSTFWKLVSERGGIPQDFAYWGSFAFFPGIVPGWKIVAFVSICAATILIFKLGVTSSLLTRSQAFWVALLAGIFPAFQTWILLGTSQYLVYYALFLAGWLFALNALRSPHREWLWWSLAFITFLVAFRLNSLLVLHFGFLALLIVVMRGSWSSPRSRIGVLIGMAALPFAYWAVIGQFKPYGTYARYNAFYLTPTSLISSARQFGTYAVLHVNSQALAAGLQLIPLTLLLIAAALFVLPSIDGRSRSGLVLFGCGLVGFTLGSLPYVLVGDSPADGWRGRHALLIALPMAMVIVGALAALSATGTLPAQVAKVVIILISVGYAVSTVNIYIAWEYRAIKDQAVMSKLATDPIGRSSSVFWIDDQFPASPESHYRFYEWSAMFWRVYGDESRIGFDTAYYDHDALQSFVPYYTASYDLGTFNPRGCQANMSIRPGPAADNPYRLVAEYTFDKFFAPNQERELVERSAIVSVTAAPRLPNEQTECTSGA
jgi:hypothetical protein